MAGSFPSIVVEHLGHFHPWGPAANLSSATIAAELELELTTGQS